MLEHPQRAISFVGSQEKIARQEVGFGEIGLQSNCSPDFGDGLRDVAFGEIDSAQSEMSLA